MGCDGMGWDGMGWDTVRCDTPLRFFVGPLRFLFEPGAARLQFPSAVCCSLRRRPNRAAVVAADDGVGGGFVVVGCVADVVKVSAVYYCLLLCVVYFLPAKGQGF